jgi:methylmalonyl-CoA mutase cobalamin-binding subunit
MSAYNMEGRRSASYGQCPTAPEGPASLQLDNFLDPFAFVVARRLEGMGPPLSEALLQTLQGEIIPRLLLSYADPAALPVSAAQSQATHAFTETDRSTFLDLIRYRGAAAALSHVAMLHAGGATFSALAMDLMANCARQLGVMWEEDTADFTEVTIGLNRLHQVLHGLADQHQRGANPAGLVAHKGRPSVLLANACGDQHIFGLVIVAEIFRQGGWQVWCEPGISRQNLTQLIGSQHFDVVGLSLAISDRVDQLGEEIRQLRAVSANTGIRVFVGGRIFTEQPDLAPRIGADAVSTDADKVLEVAGNLLALSHNHC